MRHGDVDIYFCQLISASFNLAGMIREWRRELLPPSFSSPSNNSLIQGWFILMWIIWIIFSLKWTLEGINILDKVCWIFLFQLYHHIYYSPWVFSKHWINNSNTSRDLSAHHLFSHVDLLVIFRKFSNVFNFRLLLKHTWLIAW